MATRKKYLGLGDYVLGHRRTKPRFLDDVNDLIDWCPIAAFLKKKLNARPTLLAIRRIRRW